eukprot:1148836-Pelagomonas_calceolata.AAC.1
MEQQDGCAGMEQQDGYTGMEEQVVWSSRTDAQVWSSRTDALVWKSRAGGMEQQDGCTGMEEQVVWNSRTDALVWKSRWYGAAGQMRRYGVAGPMHNYLCCNWHSPACARAGLGLAMNASLLPAQSSDERQSACVAFGAVTDASLLPAQSGDKCQPAHAAYGVKINRYRCMPKWPQLKQMLCMQQVVHCNSFSRIKGWTCAMQASQAEAAQVNFDKGMLLV